MSSITPSPKKFTFKSQDCPFFGHILTPKGLLVDTKKVEAIVSMEVPDNLKDVQFPRKYQIAKQIDILFSF